MAKTHFLGAVEFGAHRLLADLAAGLSKAIGVIFVEEVDGKFDEVPAYVGSIGGIQLTLFGPTDDQEARECIFEVSFRTALSPTVVRDSAPDFFKPLFVSSEIDATGHIDCSIELVNLLKTNGFSDCKLIN